MTAGTTQVCIQAQASSKSLTFLGRSLTTTQLEASLDLAQRNLLNGPWGRESCGSNRRVTDLVIRAATKGFGNKPDPKPAKKASSPVKTAQLDSLPQGGQANPKPASASPPAEEADDVIPEVVTDRILRRLVVTVGIPLLVGVAFFPLFYYLKVIQKVDIPEWLPLVTSSMTFGLAGLGISYGVISTSWDPQREGSLLGWKEAKANLPVFTQTLTRKKR